MLPGAAVVAFGFSSGGYFARFVALGVIVLCAVLAVSALTVRSPMADVSPAAVVVAAALALLAAWTLLSEGWSDGPGRALFESDRTLLYLLAFLAMAVLVRTVDDVRWVLRGVLAGMFVVAGSGLISRVLPELWPTEPNVANDRLSYPLTYWNALGALASCGFVLAFAMTSDLREHAAGRLAAAASLPVFAATILFTFSRASMIFGILALVIFLVVGRPRGALSGLLVLPAATVALTAAYNAEALASTRPTTPIAVDQGRDVAVVVIFCMVAAAIARFALLRLDDRAAAFRLRRTLPVRRVGVIAAAAVAAVVAISLAAGGAAELDRQYDRFVTGDQIETGGSSGSDFRSRLANPGNNGRREQWRVAFEAFENDRVKGQGAGTYVLSWYRHREREFQVEDAHSLYIETLAELGIVGLLLVLAVLGTILVGIARRTRGPDRVLYAGLFAAVVLWALVAGVDWQWEMPSVTIWVFAAAGAVFAVGLRRRAEPPAGPRRAVRLAVAGACVLLAVAPLRVAQSEFASQASKRAFARADCSTAMQRAEDAIKTLAVTPEPHEIVAYCHLRRGRPQAAVTEMQNAVAKDSRNWRVHYGLALALGADGQDPRAEIARAAELNPLEPLATETKKVFDATTDPQTWRRGALRAPLPTD